MSRLVNVAADALHRMPTSRTDIVSDAIIQDLRRKAVLPEPQEHEVRLAVGFCVGLTAALCQRLLDIVAARFSDNLQFNNTLLS